MQEAAFKAFRSRVFALYDREQYAEALALIDEKAGEFPDFESDLYFWRACLHGRLGNRSSAIGALRDAAARGHWYHERMLRDPDLDLIRDSQELAELQRTFRERHQQAEKAARPQRQVWEPAGRAQGLLVAMHGAGGSILTEGDYWRAATDAGWRVAVLQSSQVFAPGRYHWLDAARATEELRRHLDELGPSRLTILAGFSMGGGMAIRASLSGAVASQGFLVVAPSFRMDQVMPLINDAPRGLRGYIVVGTEDWSHRTSTDLAGALGQAGIMCRVEEHHGLGHDYPAEFAASLRRGLEFLQSA